MNNVGRLIIMVSFIAVVVSFGISYPTTVLYMDLKDLTLNSQSIITGTIRNKISKWDKSKKFIYSEYTVDVIDSIKGNSMERMHFIVPGGKIGNVGMVIHGAPDFKKNEEVLVFLSEIDNPLNNEDLFIPTVTGYSMGKFSVYLDQKTGIQMVENDPSELSIVTNVNGSFKGMAKKSIKKPLKEVIRDIQKLEEDN